VASPDSIFPGLGAPGRLLLQKPYIAVPIMAMYSYSMASRTACTLRTMNAAPISAPADDLSTAVISAFAVVVSVIAARRRLAS
jgi:hypothetical protein